MTVRFGAAPVAGPTAGAPPSPALLGRLAELTDDRGFTADPERIAPHLLEDRGLYRGAAAALLRPRDAAETAAMLAACAAEGVSVTPQGGNTGHACAGVPTGGVVLALDRMNAIRDCDPIDMTMTVEAGCVLQTIKDRAAADGRLFPLSLASQGRCQIGGALSTNAGGVNTLRYGAARDLALGLEVALADGTVWSRLNPLRKDNAGYALRHLFIGAEGTLGVITAATLRLFPAPRATATAFVALPALDAAPPLLARLRAASGDALTAFEAMSAFSVAVTARHMPDCANPLGDAGPWYALIELSSSRPGDALDALMEETLCDAAEAEELTDGVVAANLAQAARFWRIRERIADAQKREGGSIKHDVSVPVRRVPAFVAAAEAAALRLAPGCRPCVFGHVGDGNVHFNVTQPEGGDRDAFMALWGAMNEAVFAQVDRLGGSIAAEHGVGLLRRDALAAHAGAPHVDLMRRIKRALDPNDIMNPGKTVPNGDASCVTIAPLSTSTSSPTSSVRGAPSGMRGSPKRSH